MAQTDSPKSNTDIFPGNGSGDDNPHGNWQDSMAVGTTTSMSSGNNLQELLTYLSQMSSYIERQTNPYTGASLPQPTIGQGSYANPQIPPPPGQ